MTALVRIALRRPYTFVVLALLLLIIGPLAAWRTPVDIFPEIRIPVIAVIWGYTGLPPAEMAGRMVTQFERALTTTVNDIEHIEANSYTGVGIVKVLRDLLAETCASAAEIQAVMIVAATPPTIIARICWSLKKFFIAIAIRLAGTHGTPRHGNALSTGKVYQDLCRRDTEDCAGGGAFDRVGPGA